MKTLMVASKVPATFVYTDKKILEGVHSVDFVSFRWTAGIVTSLIRRARSSDLVFCWFAGHHTYLAALSGRLANKRVIVAAADYDLADEPSFDYGSMRGGPRKWINNHIFSIADVVVVPSEFSYGLAVKNTVLGSTRSKLCIIPQGFEDRTGSPRGERERATATVGEINRENWIRKGHREFVEATDSLSRVPAYLVGALSDQRIVRRIKTRACANLYLTGFLPEASLNALLARVKVYAQLSYMEGFGCALAEAMLAGCIPVVTDRGALPEVVGDCGFYTKYADVHGARDALEAALADNHLGSSPREKVLDCFPYRRRQAELLRLVAG